MRDLSVVAIVVVMALMALRRPWIGVMLWTWLSIMNPHRFTWGFAATSPLAAIAAGATLLGFIFTRERQTPFQGSPVVWFVLLSLWMTLSWFLGYDPQGDYEMWSRVMKINFMILVSLMLLSNKYHLLAFAWVVTGSIALLGAKGGLFTVLHGGNYLVWGPPGSFIGGNNEFAVALVMTIPLLHFLQLQLKKTWQRHLLTLTMLLCAAAALGSHSRGALLAIVAMGGVLWWRSRRKLLMGVGILLIGLLLLPMMPDEWWSRMHTIETYEQDASAMGRINAWGVAWQVALHNFFGAGMSYQHQVYFLLYGTYETTVRAAHSIYLQMLGNHGFVGLILYLGFGLATFWQAGWLRNQAKQAKNIPQLQWAVDLGSMVQVSLVGFAVGGAFLSLQYFDLPYDLMVLVVLARRWVETKGWERDPTMPFLQYVGLKRGKPGKPQKFASQPGSDSASYPDNPANPDSSANPLSAARR